VRSISGFRWTSSPSLGYFSELYYIGLLDPLIGLDIHQGVGRGEYFSVFHHEGSYITRIYSVCIHFLYISIV